MGQGMDEWRVKYRDEVCSLLLVAVGMLVCVSYSGWYWSWRGSVHHAAPVPRDLNLLTAAELQTLPGVGRGTAAKIVAYRDQIGGFQSIEQLGEVDGIGPQRVARWRPFLFVGGKDNSSDRKDVSTDGRPISVASTVPTGRRPTTRD
ncbi:MAG: helix-hairpin-helix domain-containing protein [Planctomycetaceae bacterium]|nr:helix-hairpin-helix domain-containing protein [Planctomycetaceae bacterium]